MIYQRLSVFNFAGGIIAQKSQCPDDSGSKRLGSLGKEKMESSIFRLARESL